MCAINLSGTTLSDDQFLEFVQEQLSLYQVPPGVICFEITETAAIANLTKAEQFITALKGIGDDSDVLAFLVPAEYQVNEAWRLNVSVGYASVEDSGDEWGYGAAVAYGLNDRWELLLELSGATNTDFDDDLLDVRAGFDFGVTENFHLLFSAGTGLRELDGEDELDYDVFLGLQFFQ